MALMSGQLRGGRNQLLRSRTMKHPTLDLPQGLHRAMKRPAVEEGGTMVELLRTLLEGQ